MGMGGVLWERGRDGRLLAAGQDLFVMPALWGGGAWPMESSSNDFER